MFCLLYTLICKSFFAKFFAVPSLIAVNYEARKFGVKRGMRGEEAKSLCPDFHTFFVQEKRGTLSCFHCLKALFCP